MKKTAAVLAVTFAICLVLGVGAFASRSDFVIENNNCTEEKFGTNQNGKNMKWRNNGKKDTLPVEAQ